MDHCVVQHEGSRSWLKTRVFRLRCSVFSPGRYANKLFFHGIFLFQAVAHEWISKGKNCNFLVSLYLHFANIDLFSSDFLLHLFAWGGSRLAAVAAFTRKDLGKIKHVWICSGARRSTIWPNKIKRGEKKKIPNGGVKATSSSRTMSQKS